MQCSRVLFRFKLHIRSKRGTTLQLENMLPPLPPNKTVTQVLADFLRYLFDCSRTYIQDTHANGQELWRSVEDDIDYVITHPNGWEGYQQSQIYDAVVLAELIPKDEEAKTRVTFLTEGEASLHYAFNHGLSPKSLNVCVHFCRKGQRFSHHAFRMGRASSSWMREVELST